MDCLSLTVFFTSYPGCSSSGYTIRRIEFFVKDSYFASFIANEDLLLGWHCSWRLSLRSRPTVGSCQAFAMGLRSLLRVAAVVIPCCSAVADSAAPCCLLIRFRYSFG